MMKCILGRVVVFVFLLLIASSTFGQDELSGRVLDATGKPVRGVVVATFWDSSEDEQQPPGFMRPEGGADTDADGRFTTTLRFSDRLTALLAIDETLSHGGIAVVDPKQSGTAVSINLERLIEVRGRFTCDELKHPPSWTSVYIMHKDSGSPLLMCGSEKATFSFKLPPGEYILAGNGTDTLGVDKELTLTPETPLLDMGTIDLSATGIAKCKGKNPPPWNVTDARGVSKTVQYTDYKGKWLLLEFWGYW